MFDGNTFCHMVVLPFKISPLTTMHFLHPKVAKNSNQGHPSELPLRLWFTFFTTSSTA
jgi:hypothetical protein